MDNKSVKEERQQQSSGVLFLMNLWLESSHEKQSVHFVVPLRKWLELQNIWQLAILDLNFLCQINSIKIENIFQVLWSRNYFEFYEFWELK